MLQKIQFVAQLRGAFGERISELSLLFRWHYLVGAARVIADHPWLGCGPAWFKDAYMLVKVPINPEEVESPHSLLFDWAATLGVFGLAWAALWLAWLWRGIAHGARAADPEATRQATQTSFHARALLALVPYCAFIICCATEWYALGLDLVLLLLVAVSAWWFAARVVSVLDPRTHTLALVGASAALAAHAMIEVTPVNAGSAAWFMAA